MWVNILKKSYGKKTSGLIIEKIPKEYLKNVISPFYNH